MSRKRLFTQGVLLVLMVIGMSQPAWADAGEGSYFVGNVRDSPSLVPAAAFRGAGVGATDSYFISPGGYVGGVARVSTGCVYAPVYLPEGVTITQAFAYVYDNSTVAHIDLEFVRTRIVRIGKPMPGYVATTEVLYTLETTTDSSDIQSIGGDLATSPVVNYPGDQFFLETCLFDDDTRIYSVRIYFE